MGLEDTILSNKRKIDDLDDSLFKANKRVKELKDKHEQMTDDKTKALTLSYKKCAELQKIIAAKEEEYIQSQQTIGELNEKCLKLEEKIRDEENKKALEQQCQVMLDVINTAITSNNNAQRIERERERADKRNQRERKRRLIEEKNKCIIV